MSFKNSIKILLNNFSAVWKVLFYKTIVFIIGLALMAGLVLPNVITIINSLSGTGIVQNTRNILDAFIARVDLTENIEAFKTSLEAVSLVLTENAGRLIASYISIGGIFIFSNLLSGMSELVVSDMINADMSANAKYGFSSRFIITLGKNLRYQTVRLLTEIPIFIIITYVVWTVFSFLFSYIAVFALFFAFVIGILLVSITQVFFCCWLPEITVNKTGSFDAIRMGFKLVKPIYWNLLSSFAFINILLLFTNIMLAFFTCGAGLLISIPMSTLLMVIFRMVTYYDIKNLKYYTDSNTIITPVNSEE